VHEIPGAPRTTGLACGGIGIYLWSPGTRAARRRGALGRTPFFPVLTTEGAGRRPGVGDQARSGTDGGYSDLQRAPEVRVRSTFPSTHAAPEHACRGSDDRVRCGRADRLDGRYVSSRFTGQNGEDQYNARNESCAIKERNDVRGARGVSSRLWLRVVDLCICGHFGFNFLLRGRSDSVVVVASLGCVPAPAGLSHILRRLLRRLSGLCAGIRFPAGIRSRFDTCSDR